MNVCKVIRNRAQVMGSNCNRNDKHEAKHSNVHGLVLSKKVKQRKMRYIDFTDIETCPDDCDSIDSDGNQSNCISYVAWNSRNQKSIVSHIEIAVIA